MLTTPSPASTLALSPGTLLQYYEIIEVIGEGGFGIVYRARDRQLDRDVAIKEYMPATLAARGNGNTLVVRHTRERNTFDAGRQSFVQEAKLLAKFKHPALVEILHFWEQHGTAYIAMPFYRGVSLREYIKRDEIAIDESWLRGLLMPLADALGMMHQQQCYHRDISPDNILILENGQPLLLDFGAARHVISNMMDAVTVILKPGYAPVEQYASDASVPQGPWTDIYGLAAVGYFAVTRMAPPASVTRLMRDPIVPLAQQAPSGFSTQFLAALDKGLALKSEDRPQSTDEFKRMLLSSAEPSTATISKANISTEPEQPTQPTEHVSQGEAATSTSHADNPPSSVNAAAPSTVADYPVDTATTRLADAVAEPVSAAVPTTTTTPLDIDTLFSTTEVGSAISQADGTIDTLTETKPAKHSHQYQETERSSVTATGDLLDQANTTATPAKGKSLPRRRVFALCAGLFLLIVGWLTWIILQSPAPQPLVSAPPPLPTKAAPPPLEPSLPTAPVDTTTLAGNSTAALTPAPNAATTSTENNAPAPNQRAIDGTPPSQDIAKQTEAEQKQQEEAAKAEELARQAALRGSVALRISPWGDIYINGRKRGTSPPLKTLSLTAGTYQIEVRNPGFATYSTTLEITAKQDVTLSHQFK